NSAAGKVLAPWSVGTEARESGSCLPCQPLSEGCEFCVACPSYQRPSSYTYVTLPITSAQAKCRTGGRRGRRPPLHPCLRRGGAVVPVFHPVWGGEDKRGKDKKCGGK